MPAAGCDTGGCRWQATARPEPIPVSAGICCAHTGIARGQRGWKRQPEGGRITLGTSPRSTWRSRCASTSGSATGTADSSACV